MIKIVTDSTCDLPQDRIKNLDITVIPCYINFPEKSYLDGIDISRSDFYKRLPSSNPPPTTSAPAPGFFVKAYHHLLEEGANAILSIHISSALSGIYNTAVVAADSFESKFVKTMDAGQLSLGTGLIVEAAAKAAQAGKSLDEITELVRNYAKRTYTFAVINSLDYLQRSGRVSHIKSTLGSLLQIKPVLEMSQGNIKMSAARTLSKAVDNIIKILDSLGPLEQLALVQTNTADRLEMLYTKAKQYFPDPNNFYQVDVTPVLGCHLGPGAFGFVAVTKE